MYLHTETQLNEQWKLIAGVRYYYDERSFDGTDTNESFVESFPVTALNETNDESAVCR
jgi:iron complex outermembrane receptor protein